MKAFLWLLSSGLLLTGCVEPYNPTLQLSASLVVVNGMITDQAGPQTVSLSRSVSKADSSLTTPITQARVTVLTKGNPILLTEVATQPGTYQFPTGFQGQVGQSYQLQFVTRQGDTYQSTIETMGTVPPILRAYDQPHVGTVAVGDTTVPASDIFIDYQDPPDQTNYYFWRWRQYEVQEYCATCRQGRYVLRDVGPLGAGPLEVLGCVVDVSIPSYTSFDYPCRSQCWDIFYNTTTDIFADVFTNGQLQVGHRVATIPAYQNKLALIAIDQLSLTANAYRYYKLFAELTQNTGTLADSPPAPLSGNIKNLADPNENVIGYFSASSVAEYDYKFSRQALNLSRYIGLFRAEMHRNPNREVDRGNAIFGAPYPSALCIPSRSRTDQFPPGW